MASVNQTYPSWAVRSLREALVRIESASNRIRMVVEAYPDNPRSRELAESLNHLAPVVNIVARTAGAAEREIPRVNEV